MNRRAFFRLAAGAAGAAVGAKVVPKPESTSIKFVKYKDGPARYEPGTWSNVECGQLTPESFRQMRRLLVPPDLYDDAVRILGSG